MRKLSVLMFVLVCTLAVHARVDKQKDNHHSRFAKAAFWHRHKEAKVTPVSSKPSTQKASTQKAAHVQKPQPTRTHSQVAKQAKQKTAPKVSATKAKTPTT